MKSHSLFFVGVQLHGSYTNTSVSAWECKNAYASEEDRVLNPAIAKNTPLPLCLLSSLNPSAVKPGNNLLERELRSTGWVSSSVSKRCYGYHPSKKHVLLGNEITLRIMIYLHFLLYKQTAKIQILYWFLLHLYILGEKTKIQPFNSMMANFFGKYKEVLLCSKVPGCDF